MEQAPDIFGLERQFGNLDGEGSSWVLMIREKTGRMSASVTGDGESFVIFGVCPLP